VIIERRVAERQDRLGDVVARSLHRNVVVFLKVDARVLLRGVVRRAKQLALDARVGRAGNVLAVAPLAIAGTTVVAIVLAIATAAAATTTSVATAAATAVAGAATATTVSAESAAARSRAVKAAWSRAPVRLPSVDIVAGKRLVTLSASLTR
jgi:hypothetical protein